MNREDGHDLMTVLNLTPKDTSTALALFYVAYVIFDFPSNLVMSRLSPRVWMARIVIATGIIGACFAAVQAAWSLKSVHTPTQPFYSILETNICSKTASLLARFRHCRHVARHVLLPDFVLPPFAHRQEDWHVLHRRSAFGCRGRPRISRLPAHGWCRRPRRLSMDVSSIWPHCHCSWHLALVVAARPPPAPWPDTHPEQLVQVAASQS